MTDFVTDAGGGRRCGGSTTPLGRGGDYEGGKWLWTHVDYFVSPNRADAESEFDDQS